MHIGNTYVTRSPDNPHIGEAIHQFNRHLRIPLHAVHSPADINVIFVCDNYYIITLLDRWQLLIHTSSLTTLDRQSVKPTRTQKLFIHISRPKQSTTHWVHCLCLCLCLVMMTFFRWWLHTQLYRFQHG